jgi:hypothetical protein
MLHYLLNYSENTLGPLKYVTIESILGFQGLLLNDHRCECRIKIEEAVAIEVFYIKLLFVVGGQRFAGKKNVRNMLADGALECFHVQA